jgi:hypothetical protein
VILYNSRLKRVDGDGTRHRLSDWDIYFAAGDKWSKYRFGVNFLDFAHPCVIAWRAYNFGLPVYCASRKSLVAIRRSSDVERIGWSR